MSKTNAHLANHLAGQSPKPGPVYTAQHGSVRVPVYLQRTHTGTVYVIQWRVGRVRKRESTSNLEEAKKRAIAQAKALGTHGGEGVLTLAGEQKRAYLAAVSKLEGSGITIEQAASVVAEAHKRTKGTPFHAIVEHYLATKAPPEDSKTVQKCVEEFMESKRAAGRSDRHLDDLDQRLEKFANCMQMPLHMLKAEDVEQWLGAFAKDGLGPRTRNNYLTAVGAFIRWCERTGRARKGWSGIEAIERASEPITAVQIFTPEQIELVLIKCRPAMVPFVALGAFAGIRHAELARMTWAQVRLDEGIVEVRADQAKTGAKLRGRARRLIPIQPNLRAWLEMHKQDAEKPICHVVKTDNELAKLSRRSGVPWSQNVLRHSFGSYRMAQCQSESVVAMEMGNTPAMIFAHYRAVVTQAKAAEWFSVGP